MGFFAHFVLLGFDQAGGKGSGFFVADFRFFALVRSAIEVFFFGFVFGGGCGANFFALLAAGVFSMLFGAFGGSASEQPTGQAATRTARRIGGSRLASDARLRLIRLGLRFEPLGFNDGSSSYRQRTLAIFRERLAGQHKRFFRGICGSGRTRSVGTAIVEVTPWAAIFVAAAIRITATTAIATTISAAIRTAVTTAIFTLVKHISTEEDRVRLGGNHHRRCCVR